LRGKGERIEESIVELAKNRLIMSQIYFTLLYSTLPPPPLLNPKGPLIFKMWAHSAAKIPSFSLKKNVLKMTEFGLLFFAIKECKNLSLTLSI